MTKATQTFQCFVCGFTQSMEVGTPHVCPVCTQEPEGVTCQEFVPDAKPAVECGAPATKRCRVTVKKSELRFDFIFTKALCDAHAESHTCHFSATGRAVVEGLCDPV